MAQGDVEPAAAGHGPGPVWGQVLSRHCLRDGLAPA